MTTDEHKFLSRVIFLFFLIIMMVSPSDMTLAEQYRQTKTVSMKHSDNPVRPKLTPGSDLLASNIKAIETSLSKLFPPWTQEKAVGSIPWFTIIFSTAILVLVITLERLLRWLARKKTAPVPEPGADLSLIGYILQALSRPISVLFFTYGLYVSLIPLLEHFALSSGLNPFQAACDFAVQLITFIIVIWFLVRLVQLVDIRLKHWAQKSDGKMNEILVPLVGKTLRGVILVLGAVVLIQNMTGIKIGPLLASLGIGGIAVALAAKDSIANFFGTMTIIFDKPFQPGERILIDENDGTVESVGFRSTRIRTLAGHLLTIPNEKMANSTIENISRRPNIRWLTNIGITYDTPTEKVAQAVSIINEILNNHEGMQEDSPPRVYFNNFNDWSLNILVVAWYHPPDYWAFMAWVQKTGLEIMRRFAESGIHFAFPSQTIYMGAGGTGPTASGIPADQTGHGLDK